MTFGKPIFVVLGATGNQGGSVIAHFLSLSPSPYVLRAVTRDTSTAKAVSLASQGATRPTGRAFAFGGVCGVGTLSAWDVRWTAPSTSLRAG